MEIRISASEVAIITGENKYKTPYDVLCKIALQNGIQLDVVKKPIQQLKESLNVIDPTLYTVMSSQIHSVVESVADLKKKKTELRQEIKKTAKRHVDDKVQTAVVSAVTLSDLGHLGVILSDSSQVVQTGMSVDLKTPVRFVSIADLKKLTPINFSPYVTNVIPQQAMEQIRSDTVQAAAALQSASEAITHHSNTHHGIHGEEDIRTEYSKMIGLPIKDLPYGKMVFDNIGVVDQNDQINSKCIILGKLDGYIESLDCIVDFKNRSNRLFYTLRSYENIQVQVYLQIYGVQCGVLVECYRGKQLRLNAINVQRDEALWSGHIMPKLKAFSRVAYIVMTNESVRNDLMSREDKPARILELMEKTTLLSQREIQKVCQNKL